MRTTINVNRSRRSHERSSTHVAATSWNRDNGHWLIIINRFGFRPGYLTPADSCAPRRQSPICSKTQKFIIISICYIEQCAGRLGILCMFIISRLSPHVGIYSFSRCYHEIQIWFSVNMFTFP